MLTPSGCQHCGVERHDHFQRWTTEARWHKWTPPTQEQILARMKERRAARLATPPAPVFDGKVTGLYIPPEPPCIPDLTPSA